MSDQRYQSERHIRPRPADRYDTDDFRRREVKAPTSLGFGMRNRNQGVAPDQPKGRREPSYFMGKGPKNYTRSDDRIRDEVCERLTIDPAVNASDITVEVMHGEVTLMGSVDTRNTKYYVEDLIERVYGVREINNRLKIRVGRSIEESTGGFDAARYREELARRNQFQ